PRGHTPTGLVREGLRQVTLAHAGGAEQGGPGPRVARRGRDGGRPRQPVRPYTSPGGKNVHARVRRVDQPATAEERTWGAHERIAVVATITRTSTLPEDWDQQGGGAPREPRLSFCSSSEGWRPNGSIVPRHETGRRV